MAYLLTDLANRRRQLLSARGDRLDIVRDLPHRACCVDRLTSDILYCLADRIEVGADRVLRSGSTLSLVNLCRDIGSELHHLERDAIPVADRIVGRLDPDFVTVLGDPPELT
jgi:hypothetical protein